MFFFVLFFVHIQLLAANGFSSLNIQHEGTQSRYGKSFPLFLGFAHACLGSCKQCELKQSLWLTTTT